jgi:hypothetical protein
LKVDGLAAKTYTAKVTYLEDNIYASKSSSTKFKVTSKEETEIEIEIDPNNGEVTVELPEGATGNITVVVDGEVVNVTDVINTTTTVYVGNLTPGNHTVEVIYSGDDTHAGASNSTVVEVPKISDYAFSVGAKVDGRDATITVKLPKDIDGEVLLDINGVGYYANATGGKAKVTLKDFENGEYTVVARYPGDDKYDSQKNTTSFVIDEKITPTVNVTIDIPVNATGGNITVTLPENATGNVTVVVDGKVYNVTDVVNGTAVIPVENLTAGNHTVEVIYSGDDNYAGASNYTIIEIPKVSDYEFEVIAGDITAGEPTDIKVILPDDATGVVLVDIDGIGYYANVTDGIAALQIPIDLPAGTYDITVTYPGDDKYANKTATASFTVESVKPTVDIKISGDEIVVELPDDATGNVTVNIDGKDYVVPVENGTAKLNISDLEPGNHTVNVTYNGDDKYSPASNSTTINVPKESDYPMNVTYDNGKVVVDLPDDATGKVTVKVNGKDYTAPVKDGKAVVDVGDLKPGDYKVEAKYSGDDKYEPGKASDTISVPKKSDYPIAVTTTDEELIVVLPDDATGDVTVNIDGKDYTVPVKNGKAVVDISNLTTGKHNVKVTYPGDDTYEGQTVDKTITKSHCLYITAPDVVKYYSGPERFVVYFRDNDGNNVSGITVKITINGVTYERTSSNGRASLPLELNSANYTVKVEFAGNSEFKAQKLNAFVEILPTIYAKDVFKVFMNGTHYQALFVTAKVTHWSILKLLSTSTGYSTTVRPMHPVGQNSTLN